jgi:hypothetical protein
VPPLTLGETHAERSARLGTYAVLAAAVGTAGIGGAALVLRDHRRRRAARP